MRAFLLVLMLTATASTPSASLAPADVRRPLGDGAWVNWSRMRVEALGVAEDPKLAHDNRPLEQLAISTVDEAIGPACAKVRVRSNTDMSDVVSGVSSTVLATWTIAEGRYFRNGKVEVVGVVDILPLLAGWNRRRAQPAPDGGGHRGPTGLVVDARGHNVDPVFAPRVVDDKGELLYDSVLWNDSAFSHAPVVWVSDPAHPAAARAGADPMFVVLDRFAWGELALSASDSAQVRDQFVGSRVLGDGTVVVVVDP